MTRSKYAIIHPGSHDFTTWFVRSLKAFVNHEWRVLKIAIKIHSANKKVLYERNMHITEGASYQIRTIASCACARNTGNVSPPPTLQETASLRSRDATCRDACLDRSPAVVGKLFPVFSAHAQPTTLCIWLETYYTSIAFQTFYMPKSRFRRPRLVDKTVLPSFRHNFYLIFEYKIKAHIKTHMPYFMIVLNSQCFDTSCCTISSIY